MQGEPRTGFPDNPGQFREEQGHGLWALRLRPSYGDPCDCRKPQMLFQAAEALKIDLAKSFLIGDRWRDVDCGVNAGCKTIFVIGDIKRH
jgi:histidinol phosphatase-like enzyme